VAEPVFIDGMAPLIDRYAGFVLDQWGVLHNGSVPYPGAIELIGELKRRGKRIALLSNAGRRAADNGRQLRRIGFNPADFDGIVTSGEVCWQALANRDMPPFERLGNRCLLLSRDDDLSPVEGLDLELVDDPDDASFVYLSWLDQAPRNRALMDKVIETGPQRGLIVVCGNPDRVAPVAGGLIEAPGKAAARYAAAGGDVVFTGKPYRPIYTHCLNHFDGLALSELLCVGDSIEHDIKGANAMKIPSCLVSGGIHADALRPGAAPASTTAALGRLMVEHGGRPDYVVPAFRL